MSDGLIKPLFLLVCMVALSFASNRAEEHEGFENNSLAGITGGSSRGPASVGALATSKAYVLNSKTGQYIRHTEKLSGPVGVDLKMDSARPSQVGDVMVMRGVITAADALERVDYQWSLPDGVEVVSGETDGAILGMKAGEVREVTLTVKSGSMENEQIHIMVKGDSPAMHFAQSAQYNTQDQEYLEVANKMQQKMLEDSAAESGKESKLKIFH